MAGFLKQRIFQLDVGALYDLPLTGNFIRLISAQYPINIKTRDGTIDCRLEVNETITFDDYVFSDLIITSLVGVYQIINIEVGFNVRKTSEKISGSVAVTNVASYPITMTSAQGYVYNSSATLVIAEQLRYLCIQNNHATANIWLFFDDLNGLDFADFTRSLKLKAGERYEQKELVHYGYIHAIGDIASNPNVVVIKGS
jgi:hypothetical protein